MSSTPGHDGPTAVVPAPAPLPARRARSWGAALAATAVVLSGVGFVSAPASAADLPAPVLQYSFDDLATGADGTVVPDAGGHGRDARIVGSGATLVAGPTGAATDRALQLPGGASTSSAAYVSLPVLADSFAGKDDLTLSFWTKWTGTSSCSWIATAGTAQNRHVFSSPSCGNSFLSAVNVGGENRASGGAPLGNDWVHIALVLDGGSSFTVYKNGVSAGAATGLAASRMASALFPAGSTVGGYLGKSFYGADPYYQGVIDDVRVYDQALTAAQVSSLGFAVDQARLTEAAAALTLPSTDGLTSNVDLPATGVHGATITWTSSDDSVISASGEIHPQAGATGAAELTATLTLGAATTTKRFAVTVSAVVPAQAVSDAAAHLFLPLEVASGFPLPQSLTSGVQLAWTTDTAGASIPDGTLVAPTGEVSLTVQVSYPGSAATATRSVRVRTLSSDDAWTLAGYTRTPTSDVQDYSSNLANSMHLALGRGAQARPLNENYGIFFARSVPTADPNETAIRTLTQPALFPLRDGGYGVLSVRTLSDGTPDASAATSLLLATSADLTHVTEVGLVSVNPAGTGVRQPQVYVDSASGEYVVFWRTASGAPFSTRIADLATGSGVSAPVPGAPTVPIPLAAAPAQGATTWSTLPVGAAQAKILQDRFGRIVNTGVSVDGVEVAAGQNVDLSRLEAKLSYSDGAVSTLPVEWKASDLAAVNTNVPGTYTVTGTVRQRDYAYPFIESGADPDIAPYEGGYLYIATRNEFTTPGLWIRRADTIDGLRTAKEEMILGPGGAGNLRAPFWAPELHMIGGTLTVLFASNPLPDPQWAVQAFSMQLKPGGDPLVASDWNAPVNVTKADGTAITSGINLDMTYFEDEYQGATRSYVMWSGRISWKDARLYIATVDPANPTRLTSAPVLVKENEYGWNKNRAPVDEGPYLIRHGDVLNVTFSGSATDHTYATGRMTARTGADLLDPASWTTDNYPVLKSDWTRTPIELGPGHNSFTVDEDGKEIVVFHARDNLSTNSGRDTQIRRVHWTADGYPILDMARDEEVLPAHRSVSTVVTVTAPVQTAEVSATTRCVAGKTVLVVSVRNPGSVPLTARIQTAFGVRTIHVDAAKTTSQTFPARVAGIPADDVEITTSTTEGGATTQAPVAYDAAACR